MFSIVFEDVFSRHLWPEEPEAHDWRRSGSRLPGDSFKEAQRAGDGAMELGDDLHDTVESVLKKFQTHILSTSVLEMLMCLTKKGFWAQTCWGNAIGVK